jgi:hypothetical protein
VTRSGVPDHAGRLTSPYQCQPFSACKNWGAVYAVLLTVTPTIDCCHPTTQPLPQHMLMLAPCRQGGNQQVMPLEAAGCASAASVGHCACTVLAFTTPRLSSCQW